MMTGALLASVLALGGVVAAPATAAVADLKPTCSSSQEFVSFAAEGKAYLCTRYESGTLYFSAVVSHLRALPGDWTFQGNLVVTRDGATVASYPFTKTLKDFATVEGGTDDEIAHHFSLPIVVPGDYEVIMDGHLLWKRRHSTEVMHDEIIEVTALRVPIAL
ncbi:hypothetical protein [Microbacterium sp. 179-I 3D3 NHS]|uniref:hypothetical protein n=1 Tax=Microbacterium sp. 179-I 3D3 NHS TaxID=3142382 RepID=UPI0039A0F044